MAESLVRRLHFQKIMSVRGLGGEGWGRGRDGRGGVEKGMGRGWVRRDGEGEGREEWEGEGWAREGVPTDVPGRPAWPAQIFSHIKICSFICSSIYIRPSLICRQGQFRYTRCARSKKPLVIVLVSFNNAPGNCSRRMPRSY